MKHGSLFSGIGGFDLAAEWMQWENVFHCEWNKFGQQVLKYYWPQSISYNDITKTDFTIHRGRIDILTGGFPCQPYSTAGKRRGKDDERHLWPEMLRAIREIQPRWVVGENVRGLVNWNGGLVFDEVQTDLEAQGYEVQPFILPACGKDAPHRRDRVWFVAYSDKCNDGRRTTKDEGESGKERLQKRNSIRELTQSSEVFGDAADTDGARFQKERAEQQTTRIEQHGELERNAADTESESSRGELQQRQKQGKSGGCNSTSNAADTMRPRGWENNGEGKSSRWQNFPTQSPICGGDDGIPTELDGITFPKWRNESIKAYGNAVVPQVVFEIFKAIESYDHTRTKTNH